MLFLLIMLEIVKIKSSIHKIMSHSLVSSTAVAVAAVSISNKINKPPVSTLSYHKIVASQDCRLVHRRATTLGLAGLVLGFGFDSHANAAARRAPPPPPVEKKDPSINAVTAKVLASKKRKEAMKESIAKLREQGKVIAEPSQ